jgi:hypothetical protein
MFRGRVSAGAVPLARVLPHTDLFSRLPHSTRGCSRKPQLRSVTRRQPETTLLYKALQVHWLGFRATIETDGGELPAFVRDEFEEFGDERAQSDDFYADPPSLAE